MNLDHKIRDVVRPLTRHVFLARLRRHELSRAQFLTFTIQRHALAAGFVELLMVGVRNAPTLELKQILEQNLADETGNGNPALAHSQWRADYLRALGVAGLTVEPIEGVTQYECAARNLMNGSAAEIAGAILALERSIPPEYRCIQRNRDALFPALDANARLYLDDHIVHDTHAHYPDLLRAVHTSGLDHATVVTGAQTVMRARIEFYNSIHAHLS